MATINFLVIFKSTSPSKTPIIPVNNANMTRPLASNYNRVGETNFSNKL